MVGRWTWAAGLGLAVLACAGCGRAEDPSAPAAFGGRFGQIYRGVCDAERELVAGDAVGARRSFDDVHLGLHDLAAAAENRDRGAAARLLEAKQAVEASFTDDHLAQLAPTVGAAIVATGGNAPAECP